MSRKSVIRSQGTLNVIKAMQLHDVRRLICQSTLGARDSWGNLNFWWKRVMFGALLAPVFRDHELQEHFVEASGLDWTIVRPGAFTEQATRRVVIEAVPITARGLDLKICENQSLAKDLTDYGEEFTPQFPIGTSRSSLLERAARRDMYCFTICSDGSAKSSCQPRPEEWTGTRCRLTRKTEACSHTLWKTGT